MKNTLYCLMLIALLVVVVPDEGEIYVTPQGDVYQDTGTAIVGPEGVTVRTKDESFQDDYRETMKTLDELKD